MPVKEIKIIYGFILTFSFFFLYYIKHYIIIKMKGYRTMTRTIKMIRIVLEPAYSLVFHWALSLIVINIS